MTTLARALALTLLLPLVACNQNPGLWENTSSDDYAVYCNIEFCDAIETSAEPECACPCEDDSDGCTGDNCPSGGGGGGGGGGSGSGGDGGGGDGGDGGG